MSAAVGPWFRFYHEVLFDRKVQSLSDELYRAWSGLLCVSARNGGKPFPIEEVELCLRVSLPKACGFVRDLMSSGLVDEPSPGLYISHNWNGRQFISDHPKGRVKRHRDNKSTVTVTADAPLPKRSSQPPVDVTSTVTVTPPESEQNRAERGVPERRAGAPAINPEAVKLATAIAKAAGYETPMDWPLGWHGAAITCDGWLAKGWKYEVILNACERMLKQQAPVVPDNLRYFIKGIARDHAELERPLPVVKLEGEIIHVRSHAPTGGVIAAADELVDQMRSFRTRDIRGGTGVAAVQAVPEGGGE